MFQRTLDLHYDQLIIGADLDALNFSYANKIPLIFTTPKKLPEYFINQEDNITQRYNELFGLAGYYNFVPFSNLVQSIRIEDDNTLKVATKNNLTVTVKFQELYISEDDMVQNMPISVSKTGSKNLILDYIDVKSGLYHEYDFLETRDSLVRKIYFYLTKRFFYKNIDNKKDCVALSILDSRNINNFDYSETAARLKTASIMKEAGIKGRWDKTNQNFKGIKLSSRSREIYPLWKNEYKDLPSTFSMLYNVPNVEYEKEIVWNKLRKRNTNDINSTKSGI